ncbi:MAG: FecR domain-containing protein [Verrucomicrobia bacterium]|nr:FecR domain-containing protein [Verrucomicrobiota bacterium]
MTPDDRENLIHRHLDGIATAAEIETLSHLLETDEAARVRYLELSRLAAALRCDLRLRAAPLVVTVVPMPAPPRVAPRPAPGWLAAAAALLVCAAGIWWSLRQPHLSGPVIAEVTAVHDARLAGVGPAPVVGERLAMQELRLERGEITLRLDSGVRLEFLGPVAAEFEHAMRLRLDRGRLNADVGDRGKGFTVVTPSGNVIDLGTRFAVDASGPERAGVVVFSGQVQVQPLSRQGQPGTKIGLSEGEAVQLVRGASPERWQSVPLRASPAEALAAGGRDDVSPLAVHDNLADAEQRRFYGVVRGGMVPGARAFTGVEAPAWQAVPGLSFPEELVGADVVRTFLTDKRRVDFTLTLALDGPGYVYVLHDIRRPPPAWLAHDFTDTGARVECGPWDPQVNIVASDAPPRGDRVFLACSVWRRVVPQAGIVTLGPPRDPGVPGRNMMYGVAVRRVP